MNVRASSTLIAFIAIMTVAVVRVGGSDMNRAIEVGVAIDRFVELDAKDAFSTLGKKKYLFKTTANEQCTIDERQIPGQTIKTMTKIMDSSDAKSKVISGSGEINLAGVETENHFKINGGCTSSTRSNSKTIVINKVYEVAAGTFTMKQECLSQPEIYSSAFKATVKMLGNIALPAFYHERERHLWAPYWSFMEGWGSHIITSVTSGFRLSILITLKMTIEDKDLSAGGTLGASFKRKRKNKKPLDDKSTVPKSTVPPVPSAEADAAPASPATVGDDDDDFEGDDDDTPDAGDDDNDDTPDAGGDTPVQPPSTKGPVKTSLKARGNYRDSHKQSNVDIDVKIDIKGGGHVETGLLIIAAQKFYSNSERALLIAAGKDKPIMKAEYREGDYDILDINKSNTDGDEPYDAEEELRESLRDWVDSCADPTRDTSRFVEMRAISWDQIFKSNGISQAPFLSDNIRRAMAIKEKLSLRNSCPLGSWNTFALLCDENDHDRDVLDQRRYIKAANGKYAHFNVHSKTLELVDSITMATEFIAFRTPNPINNRLTYGLRFIDDDGDLAYLYSMDRKGKFDMSRVPGGLKGGFQFIVTSRGAIALAPVYPDISFTDHSYLELSTFMLAQEDRIVMRTRDTDPDDDDELDMAHFFIFEDPDYITQWDGKRGGTRYQGGRHSGHWNGYGEVHWGNGNSYFGKWATDTWTGHGRFINPDKYVEFEGTFFKGQIHGTGMLTKYNVPYPHRSKKCGDRLVTARIYGTWDKTSSSTATLESASNLVTKYALPDGTICLRSR